MKKQDQENKTLPKLKGKKSAKVNERISLNSDLHIFSKNKISIPDIVENEKSNTKKEKAFPDVKSVVDQLKFISKKYDETFQQVTNQKQSSVVTNNKNVNIYNQNPDLFFKEMQKTISIVNNKSVITPTKGENNALNVSEKSNVSNNIISPNTTKISNTTDSILNSSSDINTNSNKNIFATKNNTNNVKENRTSSFQNINSTQKNYSTLIDNQTSNEIKQSSNSSINQTYPTRIQDKGLNFITLPNQKEKIPSFADGGNITVKGPQLIEVGSDKNNAPIEESVTISPKIKSLENSRLVEEVKTFSKNILAPLDIISPQNITNNIKKTIEQIKISTTDLNRKNERADNAGTAAVGQPITVNNSPSSVTNNSTSVKSMTTFEKVVMESEWYPRHKRIFG